MRYLVNWLDENVDESHFLFSSYDLRSLFPALSNGSFRALISRAAKANYLHRICRGLYSYKKRVPHDGLMLFYIAGRIRASEFNYLSLETVLSDAGVISQIPINRISLMSSGRSSVIDCGKYGSIEFVHTSQKPTDVMHQLFYDMQCKLWRATVPLALSDMKRTRRSMDLIDWDAVHEFI